MIQVHSDTGSIPAQGAQNRVFKFLEDVAKDTKGESSDCIRKVTQLKIQRKKIKENIKKIKQRIKEQAARLISLEQQIENIDLNIITLKNISEKDDDMDVDVR